MTKTPEQMAEEYAETVWDESELAPEDRAIERHVAIGKHSTKIGFLAGYQAAKDQLADADKVMPKQDGDLLHKVANDYLDMKAARYRRVCGYKK